MLNVQTASLPQTVLACDVERTALLDEEAEILAKLPKVQQCPRLPPVPLPVHTQPIHAVDDGRVF